MQCTYNLCQGLKELILKIREQELPIKTQYKILKIAKALDSEMIIIDEQKKALIDKYVQKDTEGNYITNEDGGLVLISEQIDELSQKLSEIDGLQIELPDLFFSLNELDSLELNLAEMSYLEPFIEN